MHSLKKLHNLSKKVHPHCYGVDYIRKNIRFVMWGLLNRQVTQGMYDLQKDKKLTAVFENDYKLFEKPLKPFISPSFSSTQRLELIRSHFQILTDKFDSKVINLYEKPFEITTFKDRNGQPYTIELYPGESREGSIGIKLVELHSGQTIYSITCNLSEDENDRVLHIGCLQGTNRHVIDSQIKIKEITRTLHGLRPKALMLNLSLMFARYFEVNKVIAVSNKGHVYQALRYLGSKRGAISSDYDSLWEEMSGQKVSKFFYQIPVKLERKDLTHLKRSKRNLYSKRYALLDKLEEELTESLSKIALPNEAIQLFEPK